MNDLCLEGLRKLKWDKPRKHKALNLSQKIKKGKLTETFHLSLVNLHLSTMILRFIKLRKDKG
jgi:hypothetical protein